MFIIIIIFLSQILYNYYIINNNIYTRNNINNFHHEISFIIRVIEKIKYKIILFLHFILISITQFTILYFFFNISNPFKNNKSFLLILGINFFFYLFYLFIQIITMVKYELYQNLIQYNNNNLYDNNIKFIQKKFLKKYNYQKALGEIIIMQIDIKNLKCSICLTSFKKFLSDEKNEIIIKGKYINLISFKYNDDFCINFYSKFYYSKEMDRKQTIMVTPCKHLFHCKCLLKWMNFKKKCPLCRLKLKK